MVGGSQIDTSLRGRHCQSYNLTTPSLSSVSQGETSPSSLESTPITGLVMAWMLDSKAVTEYSVAEVKVFLMDSGRTSDVILQTDQEPAIRAQVKKIASDLSSVKVRHSPAYSSGSQGEDQDLHQHDQVDAQS